MGKMKRPRKRTVEIFEYIKDNIDAENLRDLLIEKYDMTKRHANYALKQYKEKGPETLCKYSTPKTLELMPVVDGEIEGRTTTPITPERLPATEEELKQYRAKYVTSPEARAMRISALVQCVHTESGIARIKALELLEEMTKEYSDTSNLEEPLFFNVFKTGE